MKFICRFGTLELPVHQLLPCGLFAPEVKRCFVELKKGHLVQVECGNGESGDTLKSSTQERIKIFEPTFWKKRDECCVLEPIMLSNLYQEYLRSSFHTEGHECLRMGAC